jgi:hypothetical protein
MINIVLITSIINTPDIPFTYTYTRSVFTTNERFLQTVNTINCIKKMIENPIIVLVECSELTEEQNNFFLNNVSYLINLYNSNNRNKVYSEFKAIGEGTMTECGLHIIKLIYNNIDYNIFKISGRYFLNNFFDFKIWNNNKNIVKYITKDNDSINTTFYKLTKNTSEDLLNFFEICDFKKYNGYEELFYDFVSNFVKCKDETIFMDENEKIGIEGMISVNGVFYQF